MKPSLRELFLAPDALSPANDPLVRLGALHHLHRTGERDQVRRQLEALLRDQDIEALQSADPDVSIFPLHVAVLLAEESSNSGIQWLLSFLKGADPRHQRLGLTALRNCRQFPLAVLLGNAVAAEELESSYRALGGLSAFSDNQAWMLAAKSDRAEVTATLEALKFAVERVKTHVRSDRRLGWGTVITRPVRKAIIGMPYTGFLVVEETAGTLRAVPYQMADLINRDDDAARVTASDLLREPGRTVLVAYDADDHSRARAVYALPFAATRDTGKLMARLALSGEGVSVGVVAYKRESRGGQRYRLVTAKGLTDVGFDNAGRIEVGACALLHATSARPFFTRFSLYNEDRGAVLQAFFTSSPDHYAVVIGMFELSGGAANALILNPHSGVKELLRVTSEIRLGTPAFWEVGKEGKVYATLFTDQSVQARCGTCFDTGYRVCATCSGTGRAKCSKCGGSGKSQCGTCEGTGERTSDCRACHGKGDCGNCGGTATFVLSCKSCDGTGRYADSGRPCKRCGGQGTFLGTCRVCTNGPQPHGKCPHCQGSGLYRQVCRNCGGTGRRDCNRCRASGIGPCDTCNGTLVSRCGCGGRAGVRLRALTRGS